MTGLYAIIGLAILILVISAVLYNRLVQARQLVDNGWSDIDVQLKRRADLIPRLVSTVKGYAAHENVVFSSVAAHRQAALNAGQDLAARGEAEGALTAPLARLIALSEAYPDLRTNESFLTLQHELSDTEDKIEMARRFYNGAVRELNTQVRSVPSNIIARLFGFALRPFFEMDVHTPDVPLPDFKV